MKTLLHLSAERNSPLPGELHAVPGLRVLSRTHVAEAAAALHAGAFDLALIVGERWTPGMSDQVQQLRQLAPNLRILIATDEAECMAAYLAGADAVLPWPAASPLLAGVVKRLAQANATTVNAPSPTTPGPRWPEAGQSSVSALEILRGFSKVLSHTLDERPLAQRLVEQLAEILGVVRIALFLEHEPPAQSVAPTITDPRLACVAATGIPAEVTSCVELSRNGGLGRIISQRRGVVSRHAPHVQPNLQADPEILQEFDLLGCDTAVSVRDRDRVIGVAVLGERITGQPFTTEELNLGYFLMGELGLAIRNSRLHHLVTQNHQLLSSILESITSGSLVIGPDLRVLHANRAAPQLLGLAEGRLPSSSDLPPPVLQALHAVATRGSTAEPILHEQRSGARRLLRFSIIPLQGSTTAAPARPVLVLIEDWTKINDAKQAEIEAANNRLVSTIAARFAHEIRNSLVPLSTHSQLFASQVQSASFLESLQSSLHRETMRIRRLSDQMLFLATSETMHIEPVPVGDMVRRALSAAQDIVNKTGELVSVGDVDLRVRGTRASLEYALQEVLANALQASPSDAKISVRVSSTSHENQPAVAIEIADNGTGFTAEAASRATEPFFTTRTTGVGLGLAVARKIVEVHGGRLLIQHRARAGDSDVKLILPAP